MTDRDPLVTRRDFVRGTVAAAIGAATAGLAIAEGQPRPKRQAKVTVARDEKVMDGRRVVDATVLRATLASALAGATGQKTIADAWRSLVTPKDMVGLVHTDHLNVTHNELIDVVRATLVEAGIPAERILASGASVDFLYSASDHITDSSGGNSSRALTAFHLPVAPEHIVPITIKVALTLQGLL